MNSGFESVLSELLAAGLTNLEDLGELSDEDLKEYNSIQKEMEVLDNRSRELKARGALFWTNIERKYEVESKGLKVSGNRLYLKREKTIEEMKNEKTEDHDPSDI